MITDRPRFEDHLVNCAGADQNLFFSNKPGPHYNEASETCVGCPMLDRCYEYALTSEEHGFWGGTTSDEREIVRKQLNAQVITNNMLLAEMVPGRRQEDLMQMAEARRARWAEIPLSRAQEELEHLRNRERVKPGAAKLTVDEVSAIKGMLPVCGNSEIAKAFGVSRRTIEDIRYGRSWREVAAA